MKWLNKISEQERVERDQRQGLDKPYSSYVTTVSGDSEKVVVRNWATKGRELNLPHPFISSSSWIRAIPETGAEYSTMTRSDNVDPMLVSTIGKELYKRVEAFRKGVGLYRALLPGEIEISSRGVSQSFYSSRSYQATRAGMLLREMDQDRLVISDRAPIHQKQLLNYKPDVRGDEYRLGIVYRNLNTWSRYYPKRANNYLAEEYLDLLNPAGSNPTKLFTRHSGQVTDDKGLDIKHKKTSLPLRSLEYYYSVDNSQTSFEIDQNGNYLIQLAPSAAEGFYIEVPNGFMRVRIKKDYELSVDGDQPNIIKGNQSSDISGTKRVKVVKDYSIDADNLAMKIAKSIVQEMKDMNIKASGNITMNAQSNMTIEALSKAILKGTAGTDIGVEASITNVLGTIVNLGGGGSPVARTGDISIGIGNLGAPVVSSIITGSPKVTAV